MRQIGVEVISVINDQREFEQQNIQLCLKRKKIIQEGNNKKCKETKNYWEMTKNARLIKLMTIRDRNVNSTRRYLVLLKNSNTEMRMIT